jgi:ubiquitin-protein ligase
MVSRSALLPRAAELLRNDSIEYVSAREDVYFALLDLVEAMGNHQRTSSLVFGDYTVYPLKDQLLDISISWLRTNTSTLAHTSRSRGVRVEGNRLEKSASMFQCLKDLAAQCRHFMHIASRSSFDFSTSKDGQREIRVSQRIIAIASHIEAEQVKRGGRNKSASGDFSGLQHTVKTKSKETSALLGPTRTPDEPREACIIDLPDETILSNFYFRQDAKRMATLAPGRMRALVSQVSNLRSSLPSEGIWVRHGSSRLDAMKILIMGPKDTPYHYGLFEFDLFCPADFPKKPPTMNFRTTGDGRIRFNPNLYENGIVCLSLLGTWGSSANNKKTGEGWDERISTLLQVLLSIQAMIFVDEPWYNEPGRERIPNKSASEMYNAKIREHTVQYAVLHWLHQENQATPQEGPKPERQDHPIWGAVIREHFKANGNAIMETTKMWKELSKKRPGFMESLHDQVRARLTEHGFIN